MVRPHPDGPDLVRRHLDGEERLSLGAGRHLPDTHFRIPHHERSPRLVLMHMARVEEDELGELLEESYRIAGAVRWAFGVRRWPGGCPSAAIRHSPDSTSDTGAIV